LEESATTSNFTKTTQLLQVLSRVMCKKWQGLPVFLHIPHKKNILC
jgi:hypothetical protein